MVDRVRYIPADALTAEWPTRQDAILMSYLFSGVPGTELPRLVQQAYDCLAPGGHFIVHDFMVEDDRTGPPMAALWQLQHMAFTPDARSVTPGLAEEPHARSRLRRTPRRGDGAGHDAADPRPPAGIESGRTDLTLRNPW